MRSTALALSLLLCVAPTYAGVEFEPTSPDYYTASSTVVDAGDRPFSVACWFTMATGASTGLLPFGIYAASNNTDWFRMNLRGIGNGVRWQVSSSAASANSWASGGAINIVAEQWHFYAAVETSATSRAIYLDDSSTKNTDTTNIGPTLTRARVGAYGGSSGSLFAHDGKLAWLVIWEGYSLTDDDVDALGKGLFPFRIRPDKIAHFFPCYGQGPVGTRLRDMVGGTPIDGSVTGAPARSESPPIRGPAPRFSSLGRPRIFVPWTPARAYRRDGYVLAT